MTTVQNMEVQFTIQNHVATIIIDRPDDGNRLSPDTLQRLYGIVAELKSNMDIRVVLIRGGGTKLFSLGVFGLARRALLSKEQALEVVALANAVIDAFEALPQIVVAGINGDVHGGGAELALGCDIRIAVEHATLAFPEAKMGGFPGAGAAVRLPALVGRGRALELLCTGREITATEMERIGFVQKVVPAEQFDRELHQLATAIARSGPLATRGAKRVVNIRNDPGFRAARELSDALRNALEYTSDIEEGQVAKREGREPVFTGR